MITTVFIVAVNVSIHMIFFWPENISASKLLLGGG